MNAKRTLEACIRGWFPQEPYITSTRIKLTQETNRHKSPSPPFIPSEYKVSATKVAVVNAVIWIVVFGLNYAWSIRSISNYESISGLQIAAWATAGITVGTILFAVLTKNQLKRLARDYQMGINGKEIILLVTTLTLVFVFAISTIFISWRYNPHSHDLSNPQGFLVFMYAFGVSALVTRVALYADFEKKEKMRIMESWFGSGLVLIPRPPLNMRDRGEFLGFFLVAGMVVSAAFVVGFAAFDLLLLSNRTFIGDALSALPIPLWSLTVYPIFGIVNFCALLALYRWKRWGFHLLLTSSIVTFVLNVTVLGFRIEVFLGLIGVLMLFGLLYRKWRLLESGWPRLRKSLGLLCAVLGALLLVTSIAPIPQTVDMANLEPHRATIARDRSRINQTVPDTEISANLTTNERLHFGIIIVNLPPKPYGQSSVTFTISNESLTSSNPRQVYFFNDKIGLPSDYYMFWSAPQNGTYYFTLHYNYSGRNEIDYSITKSWTTPNVIQVKVYSPLLDGYAAPLIICAGALLAVGGAAFILKPKRVEEKVS